MSILPAARKWLRRVGPKPDIVETEPEKSPPAGEGIFQKSPVPLVVSHLNSGRLLEANDALLQLMRARAADQLVGRTSEEIGMLTHEDRAVLTQAVQRIGHVDNFVTEMKRLDGEVFTAELRANLYDHRGERCLLTSIIDVTQRKRAEKALRRSEEHFRLLWNESADGIRLTDAAGMIVMANPAYCQLVGLPREALEGQPMSVVYLAENRPKILSDHRRNFAARSVNSRVETRLTLWNGQTIWVDVANSFMEQSGAEPLLLAMFRNITERKRVEDQMRVQSSALAAAANAILITDRNGKIEWVNPAFTRFTGYGADQAIGNYPRLLKSNRHPPGFYRDMWAAILSGKVWHGEVINRHKDGHLYTEEMTITPVRDASGQITHFVAIKQDVTERRQLEKRVQLAQKMEAIGTLAGGIAHDFNNILGAIFGYANLLQQDAQGNAAVQEEIGEILKAAARAKDLVQQILTFSRQREQKPENLRLALLLQEAAKFLRASLPSSLRIDLAIAPGAPEILADPTQIHQVIMNLATNAAHAMNATPGCLTLALDRFEPDAAFAQAHPELKAGPCARLTVADTGQGMNAATLERIFEPFFTTKPVGKGTGLGLAVVHGIVRSHGAAITVESKVGGGTTFRVYFPEQPGPAAPAEPAASALPIGSGQRILILDDEPAIGHSLERVLGRLNYRVTALSHAPQAVDWCRDHAAELDLVITDLTMPELSGLQVAGELHRLRPDLPILLASGFTAELNDEKLKAAGILEVLEKPISLPALATLLQRVFARQKP
jgi:PAS domain S-box-containing protein